MKVALIQCPCWTPESPPYALALISSVLRMNGHTVYTFDLNIDLFNYCKANPNRKSVIDFTSWTMDFGGKDWYIEANVLQLFSVYDHFIDKYISGIINSGADIIGFSFQSTSKHFSLEVSKRIKKINSAKTIIFGGPLCFRNYYGIDLLKENPFIDYVCFGEAEEAFVSLLKRMDEKDIIITHEGFGVKLPDGNISDGGDYQLINDLDILPFADYSSFDFSKYTKKLIPVCTSRGCISNCTFCNERPHWGKYRKRSALNIFEEIIFQFNKYPNTEIFWFNDSLINGDIKMLDDLCDLLINSDVKIKWGGQGIIRKEMTPEFLSKLTASGCYIISYGLESGSDKILRDMRKPYHVELASSVIQDTFRAGISVIFNIIIGYPGENSDTFLENKNFLIEHLQYASHIELSMFLLLKGTYIYDHLSEYNINRNDIKSPEWQLKWRTIDNSNNYKVRLARKEILNEIREKTIRDSFLPICKPGFQFLKFIYLFIKSVANKFKYYIGNISPLPKVGKK